MFWIVLNDGVQLLILFTFHELMAVMSRALYTSEFILTFLSAVTSPTNSNEPVPLAAKHTHHNTAATMFDTWCGSLDHQPFLSFFLCKRFSSRPSDTCSSVSAVHGIRVRNLRGVFFMYSGKVSTLLPVLERYQRFAPRFKPSVFTSWRGLLIIDSDGDTTTFCRVLLTCLWVVKGKNSVIIHFSCCWILF